MKTLYVLGVLAILGIAMVAGISAAQANQATPSLSGEMEDYMRTPEHLAWMKASMGLTDEEVDKVIASCPFMNQG